MIATREDIRRAAGLRMMIGFAEPRVTPELRELLRETNPAGVILFARNVETPQQVAELCRELKSLQTRNPLLVAVDQEGGRVARIGSPATAWPTARDLGRAADPQLVTRVGRALARELRAMAIDIDLAPVLDVDTNPENPVIGDRSFATESETVASLGVAMTRGLQEEGVAACGKHFPGHGDTDLDSHLALPRVRHDIERLRRVEWLPFARAIQSGIGAIMTAHVVVDALDASLPATLSAAALTPLRAELGFSGVVLSDDIEMKAISEKYQPAEIARLGANAGVDVFLACHQPEVILDLYRGLVVSTERQQISVATLLAAEPRIMAWRAAYYRPPASASSGTSPIGCPEHQMLVQEIMARNRRAT